MDNQQVRLDKESVAHAVENKLYQQGAEWYISRGMEPRVK